MNEQRQILVIDDDPAFNRVLSRALKGRGFAVASAQSAEEALALIPAMRAEQIGRAHV